MNSRLLAFSFLVGVLLNTPHVLAESSVKWKKVGGWEIRVDRTLDDGCFLFSIFERGTALRLGFGGSLGGAYLMIGSLAWKSLEIGKSYKLTIRFDEESPWTGDATAVQMGRDLTALTLPFKNPKFIHEFARRHGIYVSYQGRKVANLTLRGTYAAVNEMLACQKNMSGERASNQTVAPARDPFARPVKRVESNDPFSK